MEDGCRQSSAFDQQCYFNYCKSVMAAKCSLSFLLLTGNLAGQWLLSKWKSVDFEALRGTLPVKLNTGGPMWYWISSLGKIGSMLGRRRRKWVWLGSRSVAHRRAEFC